jgi:hypothetical protein
MVNSAANVSRSEELLRKLDVLDPSLNSNLKEVLFRLLKGRYAKNGHIRSFVEKYMPKLKKEDQIEMKTYLDFS